MIHQKFILLLKCDKDRSSQYYIHLIGFAGLVMRFNLNPVNSVWPCLKSWVHTGETR